MPREKQSPRLMNFIRNDNVLDLGSFNLNNNLINYKFIVLPTKCLTQNAKQYLQVMS